MKKKVKVIALIVLVSVSLMEAFSLIFFRESWLVGHARSVIRDVAYSVPIPKDVHEADANLSEKIRNEVMVVDSYIVTREGNPYQVIVFTKKGSDFIPIAIQGNVNSDDPIISSRLLSDPKFSCAQIGVNLKSNSSWPNSKDSTAYSSKFISGRDIDIYANQEEKMVNLIFRQANQIYIVREVSIKHGCNWFIE